MPSPTLRENKHGIEKVLSVQKCYLEYRHFLNTGLSVWNSEILPLNLCPIYSTNCLMWNKTKASKHPPQGVSFQGKILRNRDLHGFILAAETTAKLRCQRSCLLGDHLKQGRVTCLSPNPVCPENLLRESVHSR